MSDIRPKVLMITGRADPGGGPEHVFQLSRAVASGAEVYIAAPREEPYWARYSKLLGPDRMFEIPHRSISFAALKALSRWARENGIDLVHSHGRAGGIYGRVVAARMRLDVLHTPNCPLMLDSLKSAVFLTADFVLARLTSRIIAVSESEKRTLDRQLRAANRTVYIPNGVVLPDERSPRQFPSSKPFRIIHVTRFVAQKYSEKVLEILEALKRLDRLDDFHVEFLGDGPERSALEAKSAKLGLTRHVTFHGAKPAIQPYLEDAFCLLTTSRWEGLPIAVLESLATGLPAVASDTPGNNDVVDNVVGRLFELEDSRAAAAHLTELADDPAAWKRCSENASKTIRSKFSVERMGSETLAVYRDVLRGSARILKGAAQSI